mgnify:CR=1 FL=1
MRSYLFVPLFFVALVALADEPKSTAPTITDTAGKEVTPKKWKVSYGLKKLTWAEGKPEVFEMRELHSTTFKDGILTYIPTTRLQRLAYDYEKDSVEAFVAGVDKPLLGSTRFKDINNIVIEAEIDQGAAGVVELRFRGGLAKGGIRGVKFPDAKAPEKAPELGQLYSFTVPPEGKGKTGPTIQTAHKIQALYRLPSGEEKLVDYLMFKKTLKVELSNILKMNFGEYNVKDATSECELKMKDGSDLSVTLLTTITLNDKQAKLIGFVGAVPAGYRLFPVHTITEMQPGEVKLPEEKIEPKKVEPKKVEPKKEKPKDN